jgi:anti-sigma factor RsiW
MHSEWTDRLSEYLDGGLPPDEAAQVRAHLDECGACSTVFDELRAVVLRAQSLDTTPPSRDLWAGIEARIDEADRDSQVIDLASRLGGGRADARRRTVRLSIPQLIAAGLALAFASGTTVWLARPDGAVPATPVSVAPGAGVPAVSVSAQEDGLDTDGQADELTQLEELLASHRDALSPNTVRILEKNLAAIDRAITESMQALVDDPSNEFLQGHLERARQRKLEYLRDASVAFQWST